jgi:hypothetical protein
MYQWNLNGYAPHRERWSGWIMGLIGASVGALLMGVLWWLQRNTGGQVSPLQRRDVSQLGQPPARSHIQLFSHPARQERPR